MNSDCVYRIGRSHAVCQDYAVARGGEQPYVIVADGCSSSPDTDIGARLLVKAAEKLIGDLAPARGHTAAMGLDSYHRGTIVTARAHAALLGLSDLALDATLLTAAVRGRTWCVAIYGDGVVAVKDREGRLHIRAISFAEGLPNYLNYAADPGRRQAFVAHRDNLRRMEYTVLEPDQVEAVHVSTEVIEEPCYWSTGAISCGEWVAVMSDGVHSFTELLPTDLCPTSAPVPLPVVLRELLAFKNTNGVFVQRRVQRFLQRCAKRHWQHHDDLSVGVIYLGD